MSRHRYHSLALLIGITMHAVFPVLPVFAEQNHVITQWTERQFGAPIDAVSITLPEEQEPIWYQYADDKGWSAWQEYDNDGDSMAGEESELLAIPKGVTAIRIHPQISEEDIHPIVVSHEPLVYNIASTTAVTRRIMTRTEWGADESVLFRGSAAPKGEDANATKGEGMVQSTEKRDLECMTLRNAFSGEFSIDRTMNTNVKGQAYRWPLQYSKEIKLLTVHHTALGVTNDPRSGVERMRALYKYHAINKGWGDIGYHFAIDEKGIIYEGRTGGAYVVGGHAYCNNIGTIGVVLMGNFEIEKPSQAQAKSLQWLLADLAKQYGVNLAKPVTFHGKTFKSPVVGHRELLSTACPGATLFAGLSQIRSNTLDGRLDSAVDFPEPPKKTPPTSNNASAGMSQTTTNDSDGMQEGIGFTGRTHIGMNPGGKQRISFTYTTGQDGVYQGKKIADLSLSSKDIKLWIDDGEYLLPVRTAILSPADIPAGETLSFQLILEAPMTAGTYAMRIGGIDLTLIVEGRRARTGAFNNPFYAKPSLIVKPQSSSSSSVSLVQKKIARQAQQQSSKKTGSESLSSSATTKTSSSQKPIATSQMSNSQNIRIALSTDAAPNIVWNDDGFVGDTLVRAGKALSLIGRNDECVALFQGQEFARDRILRFRSKTSVPLTLQGVQGVNRLYHGNLECRMIDGKLTIINELPLEEYMMGLAEEPDTEPYEKQRAFAIAARTYALYYMNPEYRKFKGKPFDGSDDPAVFQVYRGADFADRNPQWRKAVASTKNQVLTYNNTLIRPPYFSSDDGRTRDPKEAGWNNFPFAEIFSSKPDPWCAGMPLRGHGVGMSGCGAKAQAKEGKSAEQILQYYYKGVRITERE